MKLAACAALVALTATPIFAQAAPAPAPVATPAPAMTTKFTLDTPIETIAADPAGKRVLDTDLNNITSHSMYNQFKTMSLAQVQPISQGVLTDEAMAKVKTDLAAIK